MVQITGKFRMIKSENFVPYLVGVGIPEDQAKQVDAIKPTYDIKHVGDKITVDVVLDKPYHLEYILNKEVDEAFPFGVVVKTTAVLEGDTLTFSSKTAEGRTGKRVHKFSASDLVVTYRDDNPKTPVAIRTCKRL